MSFIGRFPTLFKSASLPDREMKQNISKSLHISGAMPSDYMARCMQLIPVPVCIIDSKGNILHMNLAYKRNIHLSGDHRKQYNILETIAQVDLDRFYAQMENISSSLETNMTIVDKCLTNSFSSAGEMTTVYYDWTFTSNQDTLDYIIVTGRFCSINHQRRVSKVNNGGLLSRVISEGDLEILRETLPHDKVDALMTKVESKTQAIMELRDERKRSTELRETLETKRLFVRSVSHEIRTPLNVVLSGLNLLQDLDELSAENSTLIEEIKYSCNVAISILNDLLMYEKLEGNIMMMDRSTSDIMPLVRSVCDQFQVQARYSRIKLDVSGALNYFIEAYIDTHKMTQVLRNLVSNAVKFTKADGHVDIVVKLLTDPARVRIEVNDTGPGISLENQTKLFSQIIQFQPNALQNGGGSGLGLYISKKVVDMHDGVIGVYSAGEGKGSQFYIELPVLQVRELPSKPGPHRRLSFREFAPKISIDTEQPRVLIVDDDAICRKLHTRIMTLNANKCSEACTGQEAVDLVKIALEDGTPYDAILLDSSMPLMNGPIAAERMREMGYKGKIFGITGHGYKADIDDFLAHGADEVCVKPLSPKRFSQIIECLHMKSTTSKTTSTTTLVPFGEKSSVSKHSI